METRKIPRTVAQKLLADANAKLDALMKGGDKAKDVTTPIDVAAKSCVHVIYYLEYAAKYGVIYEDDLNALVEKGRGQVAAIQPVLDAAVVSYEDFAQELADTLGGLG